MADKKENTLASKPAITVSDYLRIVGTDGISYMNTITDVQGAMVMTSDEFTTIETKLGIS